MKPIRLIFAILIFLAACGPLASPQSPPTVAPATQAVSTTEAASVAPAATTLYISATMHIESKFNSWPQDTESFLAFLDQTSAAGLRWSIGGDIGWLEGDPRAQEIVQRSAALGVQWDVHAHKQEELAKVASILAAWGVTPTGVVSGLLIADLDSLRQPLTYQGYTWTPQIIWGGVECPGHGDGCDDLSVSLYRPASSAQYKVHDPNGNLISVGGGRRGARAHDRQRSVQRPGDRVHPHGRARDVADRQVRDGGCQRHPGLRGARRAGFLRSLRDD